MLSKEEVQHLLNLSCLTADENEFARLQKSLNELEPFIAKIQDAKTDDMKIKGEIGLADLREDKAKESMELAKVLINAPKQKFGSFAVPLMMESEE